MSTTADEFEQSLDQAQEYAKAWRFDVDGPVIVGHVVSFGEFDAGWGPYPIATVRLADGSERSVHCQREVLSRELAKVRPRIGERIGIKWLGQPEGKRYHRYIVRVDRPEDETLDWDRYVEDTGEPLTPAEDSPPRRLEAVPAPAAGQVDDGDIPF
jgi:hypothetical protein